MRSKRRVVRQCFGLRPQQKETLRHWTECLRCGAASCFTTGTDRRRQRCFQFPQTAVSKTGPRAEDQPSNHQPDIHLDYIQPFMHLSICPSIYYPSTPIHRYYIHPLIAQSLHHPSINLTSVLSSIHPFMHLSSVRPSSHSSI